MTMHAQPLIPAACKQRLQTFSAIVAGDNTQAQGLNDASRKPFIAGPRALACRRHPTGSRSSLKIRASGLQPRGRN
jgi:hypothetical protein